MAAAHPRPKLTDNGTAESYVVCHGAEVRGPQNRGARGLWGPWGRAPQTANCAQSWRADMGRTWAAHGPHMGLCFLQHGPLFLILQDLIFQK